MSVSSGREASAAGREDASRPTIRQAAFDDADAVALLHADSWRRHYRGAYSDAYLDGGLESERRVVWSRRLAADADDAFTLVAEEGGALVGFLHVRLDADPQWGALVDNLHVRHGSQRAGIGTRLLRAAGELIDRRRRGSAVYLWVQEQNTAAQAFYLSHGGRLAGREPVPPPAGDPRNLSGRPHMLRVAWPDGLTVVDAGPGDASQ